ncbi:transporter [Gemmatirosa kalamazoonensis]|nr:transporter [Gemmatirosa kalamazoonensis]
MRFSRLTMALALVAAPALAAAQTPAAPDSAPPPIEDNSFLVEEAYNQERGVVQHINTFSRATTGNGWLYTFTQEWPVPTQLNQLSYTIPIARPEGRGASPRFGDLLLNYRYQALAHEDLLFAPRLSAILPTGSASAGTGLGGAGVQVNLPVTAVLTPSLVSHSNVGGTLVPRGKTGDGERLRSANVTLGQSFIWLARPTFNVMLESLFSHTSNRVTPRGAGDAVTLSNQSFTLSPGVRYAFNFRSGLQIVPGAAVPVTFSGGDADTGVFLYLSFEHPFARTR